MKKLLLLALMGVALSGCNQKSGSTPPGNVSQQVNSVVSTTPETSDPLDISSLATTSSETDDPIPVNIP